MNNKTLTKLINESIDSSIAKIKQENALKESWASDWKTKAKNALLCLGLSATLLTGCATEKRFQEKLMKENPKKFKQMYKEVSPGVYELRDQFKAKSIGPDRQGPACGSAEADEKRKRFVLGQPK